MSNGELFKTYAPNDPNLIQKLSDKGVSISASPIEEKCHIIWSSLIMVLCFLAVWIFFETNAGINGAWVWQIKS